MGKKVSTKRNKHRAKKAYDSSKDQITWNMLKKMNTTMVEMLASYVEVVNSLSLKYKDKVKKVVFKGHGSSDEKAVVSGIVSMVDYIKKDINLKIEEKIERGEK